VLLPGGDDVFDVFGADAGDVEVLVGVCVQDL